MRFRRHYDALSDIFRGYRNWANSRNICGWSDEIDARNRYGGTRDIPTRIDSGANCTGADGVYMVDFGVLPSRYVGYNCTYGIADGESDEADIKFNRSKPWFTGDIPADCDQNKRYSIENVMTHEAGHTYGLGDYYWQATKHMTMHGSLFVCDRRAVTLGWGDVKLARSKY